MRAVKWGGALLWAALALGLGTAGQASAQQGPVHRFEALIEGRSRLIVRRNSVQWFHLDGVAPGREGGRNEPTVVNGVLWLPDWPDVPDAENRDCGCLSDVFTGLNPPPLTQPAPIPRIVRGRAVTRVVQIPHPTNDFTLALDLDDTSVGGADTYIVEIDLIPQHDFASFVAEATVRLDLNNAVGQGQVPPANDMDLLATFTLAAASEGIDPVREAVTISAGTTASTILPGSFRRTSPGRFDFQGDVLGFFWRVTIIQRAPRTFELIAGVSGTTFNGSAVPLNVLVVVGNDRGSSVLAEGEMTTRTQQP